MYKIRDVFRCKPGKAKDLVARLQKTVTVSANTGGMRNAQVMVDAVATYWTVVMEVEVDSIAQFEQQMAEYSSRPEFRDAMAGYMDFVDGGYREIWRIV